MGAPGTATKIEAARDYFVVYLIHPKHVAISHKKNPEQAAADPFV